MTPAPAPLPPVVPHGFAEICRVFGDIRQYVRPDGTLRPEWERHELAMAALPAPLELGWDADLATPGYQVVTVRRIRCHRLLTDVFENTFLELYQAGCWPRLKTFGGCFSYRPKRTSRKLSVHSWGIAIDLNEDTNARMPGDMDPEVIAIFQRHRFKWGGEFDDPMHFQYATGY